MTEKAIKILAMDTALDACSVAILHGNTVLAASFEKRKRGHAETLLPLIKSLMNEAGLQFSDLDMLATTVGPGTFTGLRIGLAAARGISLASGRPCVGITTLEALAASVPEDLARGRTILASADARRKEVYMQLFQAKTLATVSEAKAAPLDQVRSLLPDTPILAVGGGSQILKDAGQFDGIDVDIPDLETNPDARIVAKLAIEKGIPSEPFIPPAPLYLRAPDAKLPGGINPADIKP
ncbi:tRNA (adenosine(37)-N6)-threonylcarbamoyltransferase complex dimerization subunit type 1 TsaB [Sneathiella sp. P13V-1]|uniref:tRNA (adenosine(37)-N6)-threonylcarbamoyltransferase complex dimerization subunit type 1 TsaB n=1 Tax=Sneathiella sp. P13V-1 TaxID=2697366 RepID=UPI00187B27DC|nr:tRNA (adenosine(37)-N6)-threonylcarbamoyltransferase complex dimerization subunit type 1 TsaB [Sneathiella sp. P13V-1]MBE7635848.1 tRNA (adenosine(37)-N6)-threonylcarbamoyltransferase complex dimerization subunit type 1 TsaB [Sneathiella sp. P13V-1]